MNEEAKWRAIEQYFKRDIFDRCGAKNFTAQEIKTVQKVLPAIIDILKDFDCGDDFTGYYGLTEKDIEEFENEQEGESLAELEEREYYVNVLAPQLSGLNKH